MMIEMQKRMGRLEPVDTDGHQLIGALRNGQSVLVEVKRARNIGQHRKLFALLKLVQPNTGFPNVFALLNALKAYLGHYDISKTKGGKEVAVLKSISFAAMPQDEFNAFYEGCVHAIVEHFIPGLDPGDLRREVEDLCQVRAA